MLGRILVAIGGLIVVALFAALLAPFFVDWSSFRVAFEDQASRMLGKKVTVQGSVDARILPFPSVTLHDVQIGQDVDGQPLMRAKQFSMDMELAPFLSGEARIFDMRIDQPKVRFRILKDGTLEWLRGSRAGLSGRKVVIDDVHINDGEIDVVDERTGQARTFTGLTAEMSAEALSGPWRGDGTVTVDGAQARFNLTSGAIDTAARALPLRLRILPGSQPVQVDFDGTLSTADNKPSYAGKFNFAFLQQDRPAPAGDQPTTRTETSPTPGPRASGSFELTGERARVPDYRLEVGPTDNPYVVTGEATLDTGLKPEFLLTADGQQIDVNRLTDGPHGKTGRDPSASAQRRINAFLRIAAAIPIPQVPGHATLKLPAVVINDTTIRDIRLDVRPAGVGWTVDNAVMTLPGRTQLEAKGALNLRNRTSFVGNMLLASNQPSGLADWLSGRVDPAIRQLKSAGFSADVNLTPDLQRFENLELDIGPATLKGRLERESVAGQMPSLSMALAGNEIDIDAMRALASLVTGDDAGQDMLDHKVAASLKADKFTAFGVAATKVDTAFTMGQGVLSLDRLSVGDIDGVRIAAKGRVEGSLLSYNGSGSISLKSADPSRFLGMLRDHLPAHPLLARLAHAGPWYADTDLLASIAVGGKNARGADVQVSGKANGSTISANLNLPGLFDLTGGDDMALSASVQNPKATTVIGQAGFDPLPFEGDGAASLDINLKPGQGGQTSTNIKFATPKTSVTLAGNLALGADGFGAGKSHVSLQSADLSPYVLIAGLALPDFGTSLPARFDADMTLSADAAKLSGIAGEVGGNPVAGALSMDRRASDLPVTGNLHVGTLDLAWLGETVFGPLTGDNAAALSKKPLAPPFMGAADIGLDLTADTLRTDGYGPVTDFSTRLIQRAGGLMLDNAAGTWRGGRIGGRLMASNGEGTGILQMRLKADGADLDALAWAPGGTSVATGRVGFDVAAEATGKSVDEVLHGISGSGEMRLKDFRINGLNADALPPIMASIDRSGAASAANASAVGAGSSPDKSASSVTDDKVRPLVAGALFQGTTDVGDLTVPLTISAGTVRIQNVAATSARAKLDAEGQFDLVNGRINADLGIGYDAGDEAVAGGAPGVKLAFSGRLAAPQTQVDVGPMTNFLSLRAFEQQRRRVETLQASVLEKQRLRREVALYTFVADQRAVAIQKAEAEQKARADAEAAARRAQAQNAASSDQAGGDGAGASSKGGAQLPVPPNDNMFTNPVPGQPQIGAPAGGSSLPGVKP